MPDSVTAKRQQTEEKQDTVVLDKRLIIELLKTLEGIKRVLHSCLKT